MSTVFAMTFTTNQVGGNSSKNLTVQVGKQYQLKFDLLHQSTSAVRVQVIEGSNTIVDASNLIDGSHSFSFTPKSNTVTLKFIREDNDNLSRDFEVNNLIYEEVSLTAQVESNHVIGRKEYELNDHLGNVRTVISDKKVNGNVEVVSAIDYLPFGMAARNYSNGSSVRYGYQNQEKMFEISTGDFIFDARMFSSRLGKWFSPDPCEKNLPSSSTYAFCLNNPIFMFDIDGCFPYTVQIRSYHPNQHFGAMGGVYGAGFAGDNRGFSCSTAGGVSARVHQQFTFDVAKQSVTNKKTWCHPSHDDDGGTETGVPTWQVSDMSKLGESSIFNASYSASNPLATGAPDIDVNTSFTVKEDVEKGMLSVSFIAHGDDFPNTEAILSDSKGQTIYLGVDVREMGNDDKPVILAGGATTKIMDMTLDITIDKDGGFTGVKYCGTSYSISEWNAKFTSKDAKPTD